MASAADRCGGSRWGLVTVAGAEPLMGAWIRDTTKAIADEIRRQCMGQYHNDLFQRAEARWAGAPTQAMRSRKEAKLPW
jgi:hypothetical protein